MLNLHFTFFVVLLSKATFGAAPAEVLFLISSQATSPYHRQLSANIRHDILQQSRAYADYKIHVRLSLEIYNHPGYWSLLNTLPRLQEMQLVNNNTKWIIVCDEHTEIKVKPLLSKLSLENNDEPLLLGYPLYDQEATIVHHFAFFESPKWFPYPLLRSGVILSAVLFKNLISVVAGEKVPRLSTGTTDFSIDSAHELARFVFENIHIKREANQNYLPISMGKTTDPTRFENVQKLILRRAPYICKNQKNTNNKEIVQEATSALHCAIYAKPVDTHFTSCIFPIQREQVFVAIKTCQRFHNERIPIIEATWAPYITHKRYYSDAADDSIPTINTGIPNVETGHCEKTLAILKLALKEIEQTNQVLKTNNTAVVWLLLSDDDTLMSIPRLCDLLRCFNHTEMVYLGERYGYRLHAKDGFNYITGGGGIVLSIPTVSLIVEHCSCPTSTSPDDMILGSCLHRLGIEPIHSSQFHQARPNDYPRELLELEQPISFHKFWQLNPLHAYKRWLAIDDHQVLGAELLMGQSSHLKDILTMNSKSDLTSSTNSTCESDKPIRTSFASLKPESSTHMDL